MKESREDAIAAIQIDGTYVRAYERLTTILVAEEQYLEAVKVCQRVWERTSRNPAAILMDISTHHRTQHEARLQSCCTDEGETSSPVHVMCYRGLVNSFYIEHALHAMYKSSSPSPLPETVDSMLSKFRVFLRTEIQKDNVSWMSQVYALHVASQMIGEMHHQKPECP
eukprot:PhF_6_TR33835/c0_g1_i1/m.49621